MPLNRKTREPFRRPGGGIVVSTVDDNPKAKAWKRAVMTAALKAVEGDPLRCPLGADFTFYVVRPKSHFNSKGEMNKAGLAMPRPISRPDALKLARSVEDAMQGVVYKNDSQIVVERVEKRWGDRARCEVEIWEVQ